MLNKINFVCAFLMMRIVPPLTLAIWAYWFYLEVIRGKVESLPICYPLC